VHLAIAETREICGCARTWRRHLDQRSVRGFGCCQPSRPFLADAVPTWRLFFLKLTPQSCCWFDACARSCGRHVVNCSDSAIRFLVLRHLAHYGVNMVYHVALIRDGLHECLCLQIDNGLGIEFLLFELKISLSTMWQK